MGILQTVVKTVAAETDASASNLISIPIVIDSGLNHNTFDSKCTICAVYGENESIKNIIDAVIKHMETQYHHLKFNLLEIDAAESFVKRTIGYGFDGYQQLIDESITLYHKNDITNKGIHMIVTVNYEHKVIATDITCKYMLEKRTYDPLQCPIYYQMKQHYQWNKENLHHLNDCIHFKDEVQEKSHCRYHNKCKAFIRLERGGNNITDLCHIALYNHPPRTRTIQLQNNISSLILNKQHEQNAPLYRPTDSDKERYNVTKDIGYAAALIVEVIRNGYKSDVFLTEEDMKNNHYSILDIVDDKINSQRHIAMGRPLDRGDMLALVLYTGCDCNYDLCASQRNGDYNKWKWFDYCLFFAIAKLSMCETGSFNVFSGLNNVKLDRSIELGYFVTFVSTSWNKNVALSFLGNAGVVVQIDKSFKNDKKVFCCDVSWISKFPDECEILFARNTADYSFTGFKCAVLDNQKGIQTVSLSKPKKKPKVNISMKIRDMNISLDLDTDIYGKYFIMKKN